MITGPAAADLPLWRLALSVLASPLATLGPTLALALILYWFSESDHATAWSMTGEAGRRFLLRALPRRSWSARRSAAPRFGPSACAASAPSPSSAARLARWAAASLYLIDGALPPVVAVFTLCAGALSLLALRWAGRGAQARVTGPKRRGGMALRNSLSQRASFAAALIGAPLTVAVLGGAFLLLDRFAPGGALYLAGTFLLLAVAFGAPSYLLAGAILLAGEAARQKTRARLRACRFRRQFRRLDPFNSDRQRR